MAFYDVVMLVILGGAVFFGFWKGLAWQIASLAAIVLSYIVSVNFREPVSQFIQAAEPWNRIGAMLILFLGTSLIIWTIYARVKSRIKKMELGGFDRQAGALLGAVKGGLLCMVVTMFAVSLMGDKASNAIQASKFGPYVEDAIIHAPSIVPGEIASVIQKRVDDFKRGVGREGENPDVLNPNQNPNSGLWPNLGGNQVVNGNPVQGGSTYPTQPGLNQNPGQLPQGGYQGNWNWTAPRTPANGQQQYSQQPQYGQQQPYGQPNNPQYQQPAQQPQNNWFGNAPANNLPAGTQPGTNYGVNGNPTANSPFNGPSEDLLEGFKQIGGEAVNKAREMGQQAAQEQLQRAFENTFKGQQR